jgi:GNAT superfamily N-acetyltransferase
MEKKDTIKKALDILGKNKINNIGIINFIKNNLILDIDILNESVLVKGISDYKWVYISCKDKGELKIIKDKIKGEDNNFAFVDEWMLPILTDGKEILWDLKAVQFYLPDDIKISPIEYKTSELKETDAAVVFNNSTYQEYISEVYVKERILKGISTGIYEDNKLVSWSITQDDGAIGFLHTLKNYRKKGYGRAVTLSLIKKLRNIGELPFAYVEETNQESMNILLKLGFKQNKNVHWFQAK